MDMHSFFNRSYRDWQRIKAHKETQLVEDIASLIYNTFQRYHNSQEFVTDNNMEYKHLSEEDKDPLRMIAKIIISKYDLRVTKDE